jgi:hypothetical protein
MGFFVKWGEVKGLKVFGIDVDFPKELFQRDV